LGTRAANAILVEWAGYCRDISFSPIQALRELTAKPMILRLLLFIAAAIAALPAVLWALASLATAVFHLPISLSFRLYSHAGGSYVFRYRELPVPISLCILIGAVLLIVSIARIPRS